MKVSLKWLSEYVDVPADTKAFCDRLDLTGTGVEAVERTGAALDGVAGGPSRPAPGSRPSTRSAAPTS